MKQSISHWLAKNRFHFLAWTCFMFYETVLMAIIFDAPLNIPNYAIHYLAVILLFYFCSELALPWAFKNGSQIFWRLPIMILSLMGFFIALNFLADLFVIHFGIVKRVGQISLTSTYALRVFYRGSYILSFSVAYYYLSHLFRERVRTTALEKQQLQATLKEERMMRALSKAQNDYLKAQINPHFLFNTLDYVYHNISINSPDAADAIITLSEMMRYAIASGEVEEFISLGDEIEQVEKLIYLYQLRKNHELYITAEFPDEVRNLTFIPLVILTLVENVFKHGNTADKAHPTLIKVFIEGQTLKIQTRNSMNLSSDASGTHSGLHNIQNRLKFAYHEVDFSFGSYAGYFSVNISIPLERVLIGGEPSSRFEYHPN